MAIKETVPYDFDEIYESVKTKFQDKGYDSLYEGSNTAQLITAMSYLTSMLNVNTAVNVNETILTLANKRDNVLTDARILGYEISHINSYIYDLTLEFTEIGNHIITKYTKFVSGNNTYYYFGEDITINVVSSPVQVNIDVKEGTLKTFETDPALLSSVTDTIFDDQGNEINQYYVDVPIEDIEDDGLEVFLTYYDEYGILHSAEPWSKSTQFMIDKDSILDKEYIRLDNIKYKMPRLYFKFAGVGAGLRLGTIVEVNALISKGVDGAMNTAPSTTLSATVIDYTIVQEGASEESTESIKENAPLFHNSANRAVTKSDYIAICTKQPSVKEAIVWGGDDVYPKAPGHIWFSFNPATLDRTYSSDEFKLHFVLDNATSIINWYLEDDEIYLEPVNGVVSNPGVFNRLEAYKIPTLKYHNTFPLYIDFNYEIEIMKYNIKTSKADVHSNVFDVINGYFLGTNEPIALEQFETEYFHSNLQKRIDTDLTDITGFNSTLNTTIMLTSALIDPTWHDSDNIDVEIPLGAPYETYFVGDDLNASVLPSIDTDSIFGGVLRVDWSNLSGNEAGDEEITANVLLDGNKIGEYTLYNNSRQDIVVKLFVSGGSNATGDYVNSLSSSDFSTAQYLNLKYNSPNFKVVKNCIPRLNSVIFK